MDITKHLNETTEKPLHEIRMQEMIAHKYGLDKSDESVDPEMSDERWDGLNIVIEPLTYYNPVDCVSHAMKDYENQAKPTLDAIKTKRGQHGQNLIPLTDINDVKGQFQEGRRKVGALGLSVNKYRFIKPFCGAICIFEITESSVGMGSAKRKTYMLDTVSACFYKKNSDAIVKEIILRNKFWRWSKNAGKTSDQ